MHKHGDTNGADIVVSSSNGRSYKYLKLSFTNRSKPLLDFVLNVLRKLNFKAYLNGDHVSVYAIAEVKRYFLEVESSNPKHTSRFVRHFTI